MNTLYDVLEVGRFATKEEIGISYQRLIMECQQALNSGNGDQSQVRFRLDAIKYAYSVLSDPDKRKEYNERIIDDEIRRSNSDNNHYGFLKKPPALVFLAVAFVSFLAFIAFDKRTSTIENSDVRYNERKADEMLVTEQIANKNLGIVEKSIEIERQLQEKKSDFENEYLRRQVELARLEVERKDRQLEYERELQNKQLELNRSEQERQDRKLEYQANAGERVLKMQERSLERKGKRVQTGNTLMNSIIIK